MPDLIKLDAWMQAQGLQETTRKLRLSYIKRFCEQADPATCTMSDVALFMANPDWKPATRASARSTLIMLFQWMMLEGVRSDTPMQGIRPVKVQAGVPHPCPEDGVERALKVASPRSSLAVMLAAYAGLRRAEIASLHSTNIGERELRITGKGQKTRMIPIHPDLERVLAPYRGRNEYLFPSPKHGQDHLTPTTVGRLVTALLPDGFSTHSLRHRFATQVHANSKDLRAVQTLLGHSSLETTQIYVNVSSDQLAAAVASLSGVTDVSTV